MYRYNNIIGFALLNLYNKLLAQNRGSKNVDITSQTPTARWKRFRYHRLRDTLLHPTTISKEHTTKYPTAHTEEGVLLFILTNFCTEINEC